MSRSSWPSQDEIHRVRKGVAEMSGVDAGEVRVVVSPYRICPLGAHIDHQGGTVAAMTINKGILLGFVPSGDGQVLLRSGQFRGEVKFRVEEMQHPRISKPVNENGSVEVKEECCWGNYARGALYALQKKGFHISRGIIGFICGSDDLDSSGLSSSAAVGISYLLALESANKLTMTPTENIELDRCEKWHLGSVSHFAFQSWLPYPYELQGLKHCLTTNPGYNCRVAECREAARALLEGFYNQIKPEGQSTTSQKIGESSKYSGIAGCEPLIQLYEVLLKAPGVLGARFSGAGFRGCCIAFVDADLVTDATTFVKHEYQKLQPKLSSQLKNGMAAERWGDTRGVPQKLAFMP
ncbi:Galacturonokinase [Acorus calamus]|uniref:Galacturonokinase n=1 Tax=Acorus calamus TaxID=4465 RepID=A0AAV9CMX1_ACOCL|nr:Galacturonokinase [Acorus calamus]